MPELAEALVVIDMQKALQYSYNFNDLIQSINGRIAQYRQTNLPIIFIQHNDQDLVRGSELWQLSGKLDKQQEDIVVEKFHANAFYQTNLNKILMEHDMTTTFDNDYMIAEDTISFFENIWNKRFVTFQ